MNIYIEIYLIGFAVALFYISYQFIEWCIKNKIDYAANLHNPSILGLIIFEALGSWLTVLVCHLTKDVD